MRRIFAVLALPLALGLAQYCVAEESARTAVAVGANGAPAVEGGALAVRRSIRTGAASLIRGADGRALFDPGRDVIPTGRGVPPLTPAQFVLRKIAPTLGIADPQRELPPDQVETDALGWTHHAFRQVRDGVPVFSAVLKLHEDPAGRITHVTGDVYPLPDRLDTKPALPAQQATAIAQALPGFEQTHVERNTLMIVDPGWYGDSSFGPRLAYLIVLTDHARGVDEWVFVDAQGGEVLDHWSQSCGALDRRVETGNGTPTLPGTPARLEGAPPTGDADTDKAYDFAADTYHYFQRAFGRDSIDGNGRTIVMTVHSTAPGCPNALWNDTLLQAVFCNNVVADDVVAHEITHGVTQSTAALIYQNQPGQINEAMSDIFGELVDLFNGDAAFAGTPGGTPWPDVSPSGAGRDTPNALRGTLCSAGPSYAGGVRWLIGEDANGFSAGVIRDMWNPPCRNHPDRTKSTLQTCNILDSGGVHSGSGIMNHAFAITVDGKTFNGFTVTGIGPIKAGAIWYRALSVYLTPASDYGDAYAALMQSATDLVGTFPNDPRTGLPSASMLTADDVAEMNKALLAVEMDQQGNCGWTDEVVDVSAQALCVDRTTLLADDFEGGVNGWTVSNVAPTPYDWVRLSSGLPVGRSGSVWYCVDPRIGNCTSASEAGVHSLFTPAVLIPSGGVPMVTFEHFMAVEGGWDGGNVKVRADGGAWQSIPRSAFVHGPYNGRLRTVGQTNTNPMAGQTGFIGAGGGWGRCIIDLSTLVSAGQTAELRFDFGKDCAFGFDGWYLDNFELFLCPDCNADGVADQRAQLYTNGSEPLGNIGVNSPRSFVLTAPPPASGNVTFTLHGMGDFASANEYVSVALNGATIGTAFRAGGADCPNTPDRESFTLSAATYNALIANGDGVIGITASNDVDPVISQCKNVTYVQVFVRYPTELASCPANPRLYVDASAGGANNGSNWADAYTNLQSALAAADCCNTEIWVAAGYYAPAPAGGSRSATFALRNSVAIYGGFAGVETLREQRDPTANPTVLIGDLNGDDLADLESRAENALHVVTAANVNATAVLDGFTIRGGNADGDLHGGPPSQQRGGALYLIGASPTIANCDFDDNDACVGAGVCAEDSAAVLTHCKFSYNRARCATGGGGIAVVSGSIVLRDCELEHNSADGVSGGAAAVQAGSLRIERGQIQHNTAGSGGACHISGGTLMLSECLLASNQATAGGGALHCGGGLLEVYNCELLANAAVGAIGAGGGGLWIEGGGALFANSDFNHNQSDSTVADGGGGAVLADGGLLSVVNTTMYGNSAAPGSAGGGAILARALGMPIVQVKNSIVWNNASPPLVAAPGAPEIVVSNSDVQGGYAGSAVIDLDPQFVDPLGADLQPGTGDDDLRLRGTSPCIDAGDNAALPADAPDLNGNANTTEPMPLDCDRQARFVQDCGSADVGVGVAPLVDMGAHEYAGSAQPLISTPPSGADVCGGDPLHLAVVAQSAATVSYQWRRGGVPIDGATLSSYDVATAGIADAGEYDVVVSNLCGAVTSATVTVTVTPGPQITQDPLDVTACVGQPASFSVTAAYEPGSSLVWRRNSVAIQGASGLTLEIPAVSLDDAGVYDIVITQPCGSATSEAATLTVQTAPSISQQPAAVAVCTGGALLISVVAGGDPAPTYQWRRGGDPLIDDATISGATTAALTIQPADPATAGEYDVLIQNACGTITSDAATVIVATPNEILQQPDGATLCTGASASFTVAGNFSADTTFAWRRNGVPIPGASESTLAIPIITTLDAGDYDVVITNACGSLTSDVAALIVQTAPSITQQPADAAVCDGGQAVFSVLADGSPAPTFQWRRGGQPLVDGGAISGATTATLTLDPVDAGLLDSYDVVVTNVCGSVPSNPATLAIAVPIQISQQPQPTFACVGQLASFDVQGTFSAGTTFQWQHGGVDIPGATASTLALAAVTSADAGAYRVVIANPCGSVTSDPAPLDVQTSPSISQPLTARLGCGGETVHLTIVVTGAPSPTIQWRLNGQPLSDGGAFAGTTSSTLVVSPFDGAAAGAYEVIVTNACGSAQSSAPVALVLTGDANCDGNVNNFDIDYFVAGVLNVGDNLAPAGYLVGATQACWEERHCWGDLDDSGALNNFDIDGFVACVLSAPPPGVSCP